MDEDGYFYYQARADDMIKTKGFKKVGILYQDDDFGLEIDSHGVGAVDYESEMPHTESRHGRTGR